MRRRTDGWIAAGLFLLGILTRVPFRSRFLYHWDSVNFALGLRRYDVLLHQPHPPGYFLYVMLGRLVHLVVGDANASLVWISVVASGVAAVGIFSLGRTVWGRRCGAVAALLFLTSPLFWFHGEVALSYMVEVPLVTVIALLCYRHWTGADDRVWLSAVMLGLAGGFRPDALVLLLPLWLASTWRFRWRRTILAAGLLALTVLAWFLPMVMLTGGFARYWAALSATGQGIAEESSLFGARQIVTNGVRLAAFTVYALGLGLLPLAVGAALWIRRYLAQYRAWMRMPRLRWLLGWIAPGLLFFLFVHIRQPGHSFVMMPALLLTLGFVLTEWLPQVFRQWRHSRRWAYALVGMLLLTNVLFFLAAPPVLFGVRRVVTTTPSWPTIRARDVSLGTRIAYIRAHFPPAGTVLLSSGFDFRHPDYYLREYRTIHYDPGHVAFPDGVESVVLFGDGLAGGAGAQAVVLPDGERLYYLPLSPGQEAVVEGTTVSSRRLAP